MQASDRPQRQVSRMQVATAAFVRGRCSGASSACPPALFSMRSVAWRPRSLAQAEWRPRAVQVAHIQTEVLLLRLVAEELAARAARGAYSGKFAGLGHYMVRCWPHCGRCTLSTRLAPFN